MTTRLHGRGAAALLAMLAGRVRFTGERRTRPRRPASCIRSCTPSPRKNPIYADIYYLDHDPTKFSDYSHNPYPSRRHVQADSRPGKPWSCR